MDSRTGKQTIHLKRAPSSVRERGPETLADEVMNDGHETRKRHDVGPRHLKQINQHRRIHCARMRVIGAQSSDYSRVCTGRAPDGGHEKLALAQRS
jgi:hypothetical protein